jgi:hypothetical protein
MISVTALLSLFVGTRLRCGKIHIVEWTMLFMNRQDFVARFISACMVAPVTPVTHSTLDSRYNRETDKAVEWSGTNLSLISLEQASSLLNRKDYTFIMGRWPDPILRRSASKIHPKWFKSPALLSVAEALRRTAKVNHAVGLTAQQWCVSFTKYLLAPLFMLTSTPCRKRHRCQFNIYSYTMVGRRIIFSQSSHNRPIARNRYESLGRKVSGFTTKFSRRRYERC